MIYIATVHWKIKDWMYIQLKYIEKYTPELYKIYCLSTDIDFSEYKDKFFFIEDTKIGSHNIKLDYLAKKICNKGEDNDILIFIDGDAFPIDEYLSFIKKKIEKHNLIAIRRDENDGDIFPHPSFCATTIGFWKRIRGTWNFYKLKTTTGRWTEQPGGKLFKILQRKKINWYPILRSNNTNFHAVFFGIYENMIYHHGAGFREPYTNYDLREIEERQRLKRVLRRILLKMNIIKYNNNKMYTLMFNTENNIILKTLFRKILGMYLIENNEKRQFKVNKNKKLFRKRYRKFLLKLNLTPFKEKQHLMEKQNEVLSKKVFRNILINEKFYEVFRN